MAWRRTDVSDLTDAQEREFLDPVEQLFADVEEDWGAFASEEAKRQAWEVHGERLTREFARENPGRRPIGWWEYEAPRDRPVFPEDRPEDADPDLCGESAWLLELGELGEEERERAPGPNPAAWAYMSDEERSQATKRPHWMER